MPLYPPIPPTPPPFYGSHIIVFQCSAEAGAPLISHDLVRLVSFTGGTATGRLVATAAAATFKKASLELGGKNPAVVFADCDLDAAVEGVARGCFLNSGQVCLCCPRVLVQRPIYEVCSFNIYVYGIVHPPVVTYIVPLL